MTRMEAAVQAIDQVKETGHDENGGGSTSHRSGQGNSGGKPINRGNLSGNLDEINPAERKVVEELLSDGKNVEIVLRTSIKTPDFIVNGIPTELKTLQAAGQNTLKNAVQSASEQGENIIIDARNVPINVLQAEQQIIRAQGSLINSGKPSLEGRVTVLTSKGSVKF